MNLPAFIRGMFLASPTITNFNGGIYYEHSVVNGISQLQPCGRNPENDLYYNLGPNSYTMVNWSSS